MRFSCTMAVSLLALALGTAIPVAAQTPRGIILATTTSMQDTGLLDSLVPRFEHRCRCRVKTIAVGTGQRSRSGPVAKLTWCWSMRRPWNSSTSAKAPSSTAGW